MKDQPATVYRSLFLFFSLLLYFFSLSLTTSCNENPYKQGAILYTNFCANCHMDDGSGLKGVIPPLANADYVRDNQALLPCIIRNGMKGEVIVNGKSYNQPMVGIDALSDFEITNVINYINHSWGNDYGFCKLEDVRNALKEETCID